MTTLSTPVQPATGPPLAALTEIQRVTRCFQVVDDSQFLLRAIFTQTPNAAAVFDTDGRLTVANQAFTTLFGTQPPPEYNLFKDEQALSSGLLPLFQRALAGETVETPSLWYDPRKVQHVAVVEGRRVGVQLTLVPLVNPRGAVRHIAICYKDVTDELRLKEMAEALRETNDELVTTLNSIGDAVIATDIEGRVVRMNPVAARITAWPDGSGLQRHFDELFQLFNKKTGAVVESPIRRAMQTGKVVTLPPGTVLAARDGVQHEILDTAAPIRDSTGIVRGAVMVFRDTTKETRALLEAEESRAQLKGLIDGIPDFVIVIDSHGLIQFINRIMPQYTLAQVIGSSWLTYVPAAQHAAASEALTRVLATGESSSYESSVSGPTGKTLWFLNQIGPVRRDAVITGAVLIARDITERKHTQSQLMISDRMASVGLLAAGVAHEINNPLAVVIANLALAGVGLTEHANRLGLSTVFGELQSELQDASEAALRIRDIVRDLKIFSRVDDDQRVLVDLHPVLDSTLRMASNQVRHRARLVKSYGTVPPVEASDSRLGQVFLNLVVNAAQAIKDGHADSNEIRVSTSTDEAGRAVVEISDTGSGIPPEIIGRMFTPFFTTKAIGVGTGLGLSICHRIVTGFGGTIEVKSEVGKGTTFRVVLPAGRSEALARPAAVGLETQATRRGKVLVVDDETPTARAVSRALSHEHDVATNNRAQDALERIKGGEVFDVILCDLMMPEMTGIEFYTELGKLGGDHVKRLIFLTGGAFTAAARDFLERVPNVRIEKPFDMQSLRALVNDRIR